MTDVGIWGKNSEECIAIGVRKKNRQTDRDKETVRDNENNSGALSGTLFRSQIKVIYLLC